MRAWSDDVDGYAAVLILQVTPGSVASFGLVVGDEILRIGNTDTSLMTYAVAMETIKNCGDRLELYTSRCSKSFVPFQIIR